MALPAAPVTESSAHRQLGSAALTWPLCVGGVVVIAILDYLTGAELRVFPLYYAPLGFAAWHQGRTGALVIAAVATAAWVTSNMLAGLAFSQPWLWVANTAMQAGAFAIIGLLIASLRAALIREHGLICTDSLTSVLNSRAFYQEATSLLALCRRKRWPVTLAYLDLDDFKSINHGQGHPAGDAVLRSAASLIRQAVRPSDLVARLGGDEFVVFFPELNLLQARVTLERLQSLIGGAGIGGDGREVTASIGAVTFVAPPEEVEAIVRHAEAQMQAAKAAGGNRLQLQGATAVRPEHQIVALGTTVVARGA